MGFASGPRSECVYHRAEGHTGEDDGAFSCNEVLQPRVSVPDPRCAIPTGTEELGAVGAECETGHISAMHLERGNVLTLVCVPYPGRHVPAGQDSLAVGAERHAA